MSTVITCVAMGEQTRMLRAALVQHVQHMQGPGSHSQLQKGKGLDGEERGGERSSLYCKSETSLGYILSQNTQKTKQLHDTGPGSDQLWWVRGQVLQPTQWDSEQHSSLLSVVWAWSRLQPGHKPGPHSHRPEASSCRNAHRCKEPHGGCSIEHGSGIRRARAVQTQLTAQAKPRRYSSTSQGASVPPPQTQHSPQHSLRVTLGSKEVLRLCAGRSISSHCSLRPLCSPSNSYGQIPDMLEPTNPSCPPMTTTMCYAAIIPNLWMRKLSQRSPVTCQCYSSYIRESPTLPLHLLKGLEYST